MYAVSSRIWGFRRGGGRGWGTGWSSGWGGGLLRSCWKKHQKVKHRSKSLTSQMKDLAAAAVPRVFWSWSGGDKCQVSNSAANKQPDCPPLFLIKGLHMTTEWWRAAGQPRRCHGNSGVERRWVWKIFNEYPAVFTGDCRSAQETPVSWHSRLRSGLNPSQRQVHSYPLISQVTDSRHGI